MYFAACATEPLLNAARGRGEIAIACASGIASLLYEGGRTAHSTFCIPVERLEEHSYCDPSRTGPLLKKATLALWDELSMSHCHQFDAVDRTMRRLRNEMGGPPLSSWATSARSCPSCDVGAEARSYLQHALQVNCGKASTEFSTWTRTCVWPSPCGDGMHAVATRPGLQSRSLSRLPPRSR